MNQERPNLISRITRGEFITSVQIDPPKEENFGKLEDAVSRLIDRGITVFDVNGSRRDCMDAYEVSAKLTNPNLELIPHLTARDAALLPILNQISEAYTNHDIKNVLVVTGDPYIQEDGKHDPRNIFQTKSVGIIASIDRQIRREKKDFTIVAAVNQNAKDTYNEINRLKAKARHGTGLFMSQPVFNEEQAKQMHEFYRQHSDKPLLAGVWPLASMKTVENLKNGKIEGVVIPSEIYEEAKLYENDPEGLKAWSFDQTRKTVEVIRENRLAQGIYIVAPLRDPGQLVDFIKVLPK